MLRGSPSDQPQLVEGWAPGGPEARVQKRPPALGSGCAPRQSLLANHVSHLANGSSCLQISSHSHHLGEQKLTPLTRVCSMWIHEVTGDASSY